MIGLRSSVLSAATLALAFAPAALAQDVTSFEIDGATVQMPCAAPIEIPSKWGPQGMAVCADEPLIFMFIVAEGEMSANAEAFSSGFDTMGAELRAAPDTAVFEDSTVDGRRAYYTRRMEGPGFGEIMAIELAEDKTAYAAFLIVGPGQREGATYGKLRQNYSAAVKTLQVSN